MKSFKCPCGGEMKVHHQESSKKFKAVYRCSSAKCELDGTFTGKSKADVNRQINTLIKERRAFDESKEKHPNLTA